jgi:hypothetical protein
MADGITSSKEGYEKRTTDVVMAGDTRLDIELTAVISP